MSNITLIQLISEQTIQNLLPILRLKPQRLVHLVTSKTVDRSPALREAAHAAGLKPDLATLHLSEMPGIPECYNATTDAIEQAGTSETVVVNFTGGTKLMSIGAFAAAQTAKVPSLYVDTPKRCFVEGGTHPQIETLLEGDLSFTPILNQLRVDVLGIANGVKRITNGKPWKPMLPLAQFLFENEADECVTHEAIYGPKGIVPNGLEPRSPKPWLELLDRPFSLPESVATLAVEAQLLRQGNTPEEVLLPDASRAELEYLLQNHVLDFANRYFKAIAPLQHTLAFLTGAWWEVIVCDAAHRSNRFRDLRWSCQVGEPNGPDTEEDILGVDGVELLYINCKRGGQKARLLPLLEEIRARAATIGGQFNRRHLAVRIAPTGKHAINLQTQAQRLGIKIITGENVHDPDLFSR